MSGPADPRPASRSDRGSVTGFVVGMTLALLLCAGLVFDGGRLVAGRIAAADAAENAARAGAQQVTGIRAGAWHLDPTRAAAVAKQYLAAEGVEGSATATEDAVTVTVSRTTTMTLLQLVGVGARTVQVSRTATAVDR